MNELEKYRDEQAKLKMSSLNSTTMRGKDACLISEIDFKKGFDAAIALDLPVKFAIWMTKPYLQEAKNIVRKHHPNYHKELYQYWLESIFKI